MQYSNPTIIKGNMAITGSAGTVYHGVNAFNTAYGQSVVWGNFSYTGNSAPLYMAATACSSRKFNHSLNTSAHQIQPDALAVDGNSNIS